MSSPVIPNDAVIYNTDVYPILSSLMVLVLLLMIVYRFVAFFLQRNTPKSYQTLPDYELLAEGEEINDNTPEPKSKWKKGMAISQTLFCFAILTLNVACYCFGLESYGIIEFLVNQVVWIMLAFIFISFAFIKIVKFTSYANYKQSFISVIHFGEVKRRNNDGEILSQSRKSSKVMSWCLLIWLLVDFVLTVGQSFIIFFIGLSQNFIGRPYLIDYLHCAGGIMIGVLFLLHIINDFKLSQSTSCLDSSLANKMKALEALANDTKYFEPEKEIKIESNDENEEEEGEYLKNVKRLVKEILPELGLLMPAFFFVMVEAICSLAVSLLIGLCISLFTTSIVPADASGSTEYQSTLNDEQTPNQFKETQLHQLIKTAIILLFVMAIQSLASGLNNALETLASERMKARLLYKTFHSLLTQEVFTTWQQLDNY